MKLSLATVVISAITFPTAMSAYNVGYHRHIRPNVCCNVNDDTPLRQGRRRRISRRPTGDMLDQQFESLKQEMKGQEAARRAAIREQQEFVNRAFGLANEVAQKVAVQSDRDTKEAIEESTKFVNKFFGLDPNDVGSLRSDVQVDDEKFQFILDVPGVEASDIQISLEEDKKLVITGQRTYGADDVRKFSRTWQLVSAPFDASKIQANLTNGVLTVTVPKDLDKIRDRVKTIAVINDDVMINEVGESDEEGERFEVMLDLPGVEAADVSVSVEDKATLRVEGERKFDDGNSRKFSRSWRLGSTAYDVDNGSAVLKNGVLKVRLPKENSSSEKEGSMKISIQEGASATTEKLEVNAGKSPEKTDEVIDESTPSEEKDEEK